MQDIEAPVGKGNLLSLCAQGVDLVFQILPIFEFVHGASFPAVI